MFPDFPSFCRAVPSFVHISLSLPCPQKKTDFLNRQRAAGSGGRDSRKVDTRSQVTHARSRAVLVAPPFAFPRMTSENGDAVSKPKERHRCCSTRTTTRKSKDLHLNMLWKGSGIWGQIRNSLTAVSFVTEQLNSRREHPAVVCFR